MLRILLVEFLQNTRRLELVGVGEVAFPRRGLKCQRIEDAGFVVIGITLRHPFHGGVVRSEPGIDGDLVVVAVVGGQGFNPVAFALRLCPDRTRLLERRPSRLRVGPRRRPHQRVAEEVHRDAPIRHCAGGILLQYALEGASGIQEPVRMQHGDAALELSLHLWIARGGKTHLAELFILLRPSMATKHHEQDSRAHQAFGFHRGSPSRRKTFTYRTYPDLQARRNGARFCRSRQPLTCCRDSAFFSCAPRFLYSPAHGQCKPCLAAMAARWLRSFLQQRSVRTCRLDPLCQSGARNGTAASASQRSGIEPAR